MAGMLWYGKGNIPEAERHKKWCVNQSTSAVAVAPEWHAQTILCRRQLTMLAVMCSKSDIGDIKRFWPLLAMNLSDMNVLEWLLLQHYKGSADPNVFEWVKSRFFEENMKM